MLWNAHLHQQPLEHPHHIQVSALVSHLKDVGWKTLEGGFCRVASWVTGQLTGMLLAGTGMQFPPKGRLDRDATNRKSVIFRTNRQIGGRYSGHSNIAPFSLRCFLDQLNPRRLGFSTHTWAILPAETPTLAYPISFWISYIQCMSHIPFLSLYWTT